MKGTFIMCQKSNKCLWVTNNKCTHPHPREDTDCFDRKGGIDELMTPDDYVAGVYKTSGKWRQSARMHEARK